LIGFFILTDDCSDTINTKALTDHYHYMYIYIHPGFILQDSLEIMDSTVYLKIMILCYTRCPIIQTQDIIIAKLLPFPNKSKIINAIEYENPR
jgi:hypothetical protein